MTEDQYKQFIRDMQESWSDTFGKLVNAISAQSGQSERFNKFWSDTLGIAFNGLISQREQLKELTAQVNTLTQEVSALRREIKDLRQPGLFPVDKGSL